MTTVLVPLANGCEELEAVTVIDLLRRADISVCTASLQDKHVKASRGVTLVADYTLDQVIHDKFDALVLPGGLPGADHLNEDPRIHQLITKTYHHGGLIAAICAAPKVLVTNGITDGKTITCYPCAIEPSHYPNITITDADVQVDQQIITSRGPGTAIDFALVLIEILKDNASREFVEKGLVR
jgi:4-methyl-5(b-hydroxyethyl)-thiazole monophosphate biosynthesis